MLLAKDMTLLTQNSCTVAIALGIVFCIVLSLPLVQHLNSKEKPCLNDSKVN
jgi:hypothetical protein